MITNGTTVVDAIKTPENPYTIDASVEYIRRKITMFCRNTATMAAGPGRTLFPLPDCPPPIGTPYAKVVQTNYGQLYLKSQ